MVPRYCEGMGIGGETRGEEGFFPYVVRETEAPLVWSLTRTFKVVCQDDFDGQA